MTPALTPVFVEFIPDAVEDGKLYISQTYATAVHKCCCGCGQKVVTPLSPTGWRLIVEGEVVSLYPSIGNWGYPCRSHYWIRRNAVQWSYQMSHEEIEAGRRYDALIKEQYFETGKLPDSPEATRIPPGAGERQARMGFWRKIKRWLFG